MKKIDKKGFVLLETVVVTVFIISIFTFVYISIVPLLGKYEELTHDYKIDVAYKLYHIRDAMYKDGNFNSIVGANYKKIELSDFEDQGYYSSLMTSLFETENYYVVYIRDAQTRADVAIASLGIEGGFKVYIERTVEKEASEELENFIFINDDGNYAYLGLAVNLDNPTDYREPEEVIEEGSHEDESGASKPILMDGMIPVYYGDNENTWKKADEENKSNEDYWYDYDELRWANVVLVKENKREQYQNLKIGESISNEDIIAYYVWIPRYEYVIEGTYGKGGTSASLPGEISVNFIDTTVSKKRTVNSLTWRTPEAFTFGDLELEGLWFSKFEMSNSQNMGYSKNGVGVPYVLPEMTSWTGQNIATFYNRITTYMNGANGDSIYGLVSDVNASDAHVMKNEEWGAVAYLSQSKYGKYNNSNFEDSNKEIYMNNRGLTGSSAGSPNSTAVSSVCSSSETSVSGCYKYFVNGKGTGASTTGNIYGVYDMSAGFKEMIMGAIGATTDTCGTKIYAGSTIGVTGFKGPLSSTGACSEETGTIDFPADSKYYRQYLVNSSSNTSKKLEACGTGGAFSDNKCYSHAMSETQGWYSDVAGSATKNLPWYVRGGTIDEGAGIFAITGYLTTIDGGQVILDYTTRPIISTYRVSPMCTFSEPSNNVLKAGEETTFTLTCTDSDAFSDSTIELSDIKTSAIGVIEVTNISKSTISGGFKYEITVTSGISGESSITLNSGAVKDSEGNGNRLEESKKIAVDVGNPVCRFETPSDSIIKENEILKYTITCTDDSDFGDVSVSESDISLSDSSVVEITNVTSAKTMTGYKFIVSVKGKQSGTTTLTLKSGAISDKVGNGNELITSSNIEVDTSVPVCTFGDLGKSILNLNETTTYTLVCDDGAELTDSIIDASDIIVNTNGVVSVSNISKVYENNKYTYTISLIASQEGITTLSIKANAVSDKAGNGNTLNASTRITVDATPPSCTFASPSSTTIKKDGTTTIAVNCVDTNGFNDYSLSTSDISVNTSGIVTVSSMSSASAITNGYQYIVTIKGLAEGTTTLNINAGAVSDRAGKENVLNTSSVITVDTTSPSCSFSGPATTLIKKDATTTYTLTCTDASGFTDYEVATSDITVNTSGVVTVSSVSSGTVVTNGYQYTVTVKGASSGSTTLKLNSGAVSDKAGNTNAASSNSSSVTVDATAPSCSFSGPAKTYINYNGTTTYTLTCTDSNGFNDSTISTSNITANTSGKVTISSVSGKTAVTNGYRYTVTVKGVASGSTTLKLAAGAVSDKAGNTNVARNSGTVTVDTTPPSCSLSWSESSQRFTGSGSDSSGLAYYGYSSSYSGSNATTGYGYEGYNYYYVKDNAGNKNYCVLYLATMYRYSWTEEEYVKVWDGPNENCGNGLKEYDKEHALDYGLDWYREDCYSVSKSWQCSSSKNCVCCDEYYFEGDYEWEEETYWSDWSYYEPPYYAESIQSKLVVASD